MSDRQLWETVFRRPVLERGVDHQEGGLSMFHVSELTDAPLLEDEIRGTFMAIADAAGFLGLVAGLDPDVTQHAVNALTFVREVEEMATTLRCMLEAHLTQPRLRED